MWNLDSIPSLTLTLSQGEGAPPPPNLGGGGGNATTGANGGTGGAAPPRPNDPFSSLLPIFMVLILIFIFWSFSSQKKEKKKREALLSSIKKHDQVQTIGGIIGSVVEVKSNTVVLKVDESSNTRMTFAKSAIQQVLRDSPDKAPEPADAGAKK
ncbi:MAG: preprotein translocase subunit YajC [Phycisphaeraceae bacterium]|nr:preprotein translocase subunit YajC [Phycisphaerales bacterium]QOJ17991.1 MAG: preprotein translocase subunit YajC [Phycisphaeraceae bacterium]